MFDEILVPPAVYGEVVSKGAGRIGSNALAEASWVQVQKPIASATIEPLLLGLDLGEMEVLLLALESQPDWVLIDERLGRRTAKLLGFPVKGTVGILLAAFYANLLGKEQALEAVESLIEAGIRISPGVVAWFAEALDR